MAKAKKMLSAVLAALMVVLSVASYVPAQAAKAVNVPKLQMVTQPEKEYKNGDRVSLTVTSPNYGGQVEYRVMLWNGTTKKQSELWPTHKGYYYQNWKPAGSYKFTIHWPVEGMEPGAYSLTVLTRRANSKVSYDSFVKTEAFWVKNEAATVDSIAALEDVTVDEGAEAKLPAEVTLNMSDKTTKTAKVTWEAVDTAKPGEYTVNGTVEGTDKKATVKVIVKEVALKVESVSAITAKSFKVVFNKAVADTAKVTFDVKRGAVVVSTTNTWSENKKEITLESSVKLVEGDYTVIVKNDTNELAKQDIKITKERIAKIEVVSDMLVRTSENEGYVAYKVLNQYNEDITKTAMGRNIKSASIATITTKQNGMLNVYYDINQKDTNYKPENGNPMLQLRGLKEISITLYDVESNITVTKTVKVSELLGSLSEVTFKGVSNKDNKELEYGDRTNKFYIDYEIKDAAGNLVTDYTIINAGIQQIITSNPTVASFKIINDNGNAAFLVEPGMTPQTVFFDGTAVLSIVTKTGKMASITVTVKRPAQLDTMTLIPPSTEIASGEKAVIPFVAYDQNGKEVKEYSKLKGVALHLTGLDLVENADGTAKLVSTNVLTKGQYTFTATTQTGKTSMVSVTVRDAVKIEALAIDPSVIYPFMLSGATQSMDFGYNYGGIELKDQYGRTVDLTNNNKFTDADGTWYYFVKGFVESGESITVARSNAFYAYPVQFVTVPEKTGSSSIKFVVMRSKNKDLSAPETVSDLSQTMTLTVVRPEDVTDFGLTSISKPLYAAGTATGSKADYVSYAFVYGKLANGGEVALPDEWVKAIVPSTDKFTADFYGEGTVGVNATTLPATITEATGNITATIIAGDNKLHSATITVSSKIEAPTVQSIGFSAYNIDRKGSESPTGITVDGDTVYVSMAGTQNYFETTASSFAPSANSTLNAILGRSLYRFNAAGSGSQRSFVYFYVKDQYGKKGLSPAFVQVVDQTTGLGATVTGDANATLNVGRAVQKGDFIVLQAMSTTGLQKTIRIEFVD